LPEAIKIVYENDILAVVEKPAGMVCQPAPGIVELLAAQDSRFFHAVSVSRLDRDTSGLLTLAWRPDLHEQVESSILEKHYLALVAGKPEQESGSICERLPQLGDDNKTLLHLPSQYARTDFEVLQRFRMLTLLKVSIHTGRKHQIRRHMADLGWNIVGDPLYGRRNVNHRAAEELKLERQFLHACELKLAFRGESVISVKSDLPDDLSCAIGTLALNAGNN